MNSFVLGLVTVFLVPYFGLVYHMRCRPQLYRERNPFAKWFPTVFTEDFFRRMPLLIALWSGCLVVLCGFLHRDKLQVHYHQTLRSQSMVAFSHHGKALVDMAAAGDDNALRAFLEADGVDGALSYIQFNLTIECLRTVPDERFAGVAAKLDSRHKSLLNHYLSHVSDLPEVAPLTRASVGLWSAPDPLAKPLSDPDLHWP